MNNPGIYRRSLIILAVSFTLSAWLYCLATLHTANLANDPRPQGLESGVIVFFGENGATVLAAELLALAVCVVGMMATDRNPSPRGDRSDRGPRTIGRSRDEVSRDRSVIERDDRSV